jgi:hypothetical protein
LRLWWIDWAALGLVALLLLCVLIGFGVYGALALAALLT